MSPWQYTIFTVYKIKCCVIDWHVVFICYNTSGWRALSVQYNLVHSSHMLRPYDQLPVDGEIITSKHVEDMQMTVGIKFRIVNLLVLHELFTEWCEICKLPHASRITERNKLLHRNISTAARWKWRRFICLRHNESGTNDGCFIYQFHSLVSSACTFSSLHVTIRINLFSFYRSNFDGNQATRGRAPSSKRTRGTTAWFRFFRLLFNESMGNPK